MDLFGAFFEEAIQSVGHWVRYIGGLSVIIGTRWPCVGRFVVKDED